jgi:hypothetical protein
MIAWLTAYLLTVAIEMPVIAWGMRVAIPSGPALVALSFGASLITHPILWLCVPAVETVDARLLTAELAIALVEALFLCIVWTWRGVGSLSFKRCLVIALLANGLSFGLGRLIF